MPRPCTLGARADPRPAPPRRGRPTPTRRPRWRASCPPRRRRRRWTRWRLSCSDAVQAAADKAGFSDVAQLCATLRGRRHRGPRGGGAAAAVARRRDVARAHAARLARQPPRLLGRRPAFPRRNRAGPAAPAVGAPQGCGERGALRGGARRQRRHRPRAGRAGARAAGRDARATPRSAPRRTRRTPRTPPRTPACGTPKAADYEALATAQLEKLAEQHAAADGAGCGAGGARAQAAAAQQRAA
jgi:hypothetical protein